MVEGRKQDESGVSSLESPILSDSAPQAPFLIPLLSLANLSSLVALLVHI